MKSIKRAKAPDKLNLIPILDAVFIFIFFLLMSAQFLEIYEIPTDAPSIQDVDTEKTDKIPLNLKLVISEKSLEIKTGLEGKTHQKIELLNDKYDFLALKNALIKLKRDYIDEESIIFSPQDKIPYKKIVRLMDVVREVSTGDPQILGVDKKGQKIQTRKLFGQIIFETII